MLFYLQMQSTNLILSKDQSLRQGPPSSCSTVHWHLNSLRLLVKSMRLFQWALRYGTRLVVIFIVANKMCSSLLWFCACLCFMTFATVQHLKTRLLLWKRFGHVTKQHRTGQGYHQHSWVGDTLLISWCFSIIDDLWTWSVGSFVKYSAVLFVAEVFDNTLSRRVCSIVSCQDWAYYSIVVFHSCLTLGSASTGLMTAGLLFWLSSVMHLRSVVWGTGFLMVCTSLGP